MYRRFPSSEACQSCFSSFLCSSVSLRRAILASSSSTVRSLTRCSSSSFDLAKACSLQHAASICLRPCYVRAFFEHRSPRLRSFARSGARCNTENIRLPISGQVLDLALLSKDPIGAVSEPIGIQRPIAQNSPAGSTAEQHAMVSAKDGCDYIGKRFAADTRPGTKHSVDASLPQCVRVRLTLISGPSAQVISTANRQPFKT